MKYHVMVRVIAGVCLLIGCVGFFLKENYLSASLFAIIAVAFFVAAFKKTDNE